MVVVRIHGGQLGRRARLRPALVRRAVRIGTGRRLDADVAQQEERHLAMVEVTQHKLVTAVADAGAGATGMTWARQLRSELQQVSAVRVADLRAEADQIAESRRNLDVRIQQAGWATGLIE